MIKEKMESALNKQIKEELFSSYLYLSMSANFSSNNLHGFAHWMKLQAKEELSHAMKLYDYIIERGGRVHLHNIESPQIEWKSPLEAFESAFKHEQKITSLINDLVELAKSEKDHASDIFLSWYVNEQVEEEAQADEIVQKLRLVGDNKGALFMIDHELGQRK